MACPPETFHLDKRTGSREKISFKEGRKDFFFCLVWDDRPLSCRIIFDLSAFGINKLWVSKNQAQAWIFFKVLQLGL